MFEFQCVNKMFLALELELYKAIADFTYAQVVTHEWKLWRFNCNDTQT